MATAQPGSPRSLEGAVLSRRWRITLKLGEGGMGEVYAADAVEVGGVASPHPAAASGPRVAIKVLRPEFLGDPQVRARFLEETRTSMRLVHPNIVRVLEGAQAEDGSPYLVMELLDGVPLGAYTQNGGRVPLAQGVPILQGILAGLSAAHELGIVHRDLKPDNVMLTRDGRGAFVVKVLDFGIAKVIDAAGGMGFRTRTGMLLGTPAYMSPEQAKNARDVDQRADLWSAGVLFYEMLTGRSAFPAPTEFARLAALLSMEPEPVDRIDPALTPLKGFFERALKKDRNERFASAQEMGRALMAALPGLGGRPSGPPLPLSRLPDVHSIFVPQILGSPSTAEIPSGVFENGHLRPTASMDAFGDGTGKLPRPMLAAGGTLNSPAAPAIVEAQPNVAFATPNPSFGETLPSKDARANRRTKAEAGLAPGVSRPLTVILILVALAAGFLLGFAFGRM